jgi:S1-C subfamily serine protease
MEQPINPHDSPEAAKPRESEAQPSPMTALHPTKLRALSLAFLVIVSASAGFVGGWFGSQNGHSATNSTQSQRVVLQTQGQLISDIAKNVGKSVVSVETTAQPVTSYGLFGVPRSTQQSGAGTGIIIQKDGLIMTNRHVVPTGTTSVNVVLSDGTRFENVEVVGRTSTTDTLDIAFLKIKDTKGKDLIPARLGDSGRTNVGDSVIAIGNALGQFQNTVTSGIISGYGRSVTAGDSSGAESESLENLIQTDTAINEGNSGGPLVNMEGEVIGINTAVAGGNAQNVGFAIPINDTKGLIGSVVEKGKLERPFLGVVYVPITSEIAQKYKLKVENGAFIPPSADVGRDAIVQGSAADKAGLKEGDVIQKVSGETVDEKHSLTSLLGKQTVGKSVDLTIVRDGKQQTISVTLQAAPSNS